MTKKRLRGVSKWRHKMSSPARQELLSSVKKRYLAANRHEKSKILDELCASTGFHRKHAIRTLNNFVEKQPYYEGRGRKKIYDDPQLILILKKLRVAVGNVCAELFHPEIPTAIKLYEKHYGKIPEELKLLIKTISVSTLKRVLPNACQAKSGVKKHYKSASKLCGQIPLQNSFPKPQKPGCLEVDLVEHNGGDPGGQYLYTLTAIDKVTNWITRKCIENKSAYSVYGAMNFVKDKLPYPIYWFDTDNGREFLNDLIVRWTQENDCLFTRSRVGKKNDNAHVERANRYYVRELVGHARFTSTKALNLINKLYLLDGMYNNFFVAGRKIIKNIYDKATGKHKKEYDAARTPYGRVLEFYGKENIETNDICKYLQEVYKSLNPWELASERDKTRKQLLNLIERTEEKEPQNK